MDEKDIEKRIQEAWNTHATEHDQDQKNVLWREFANEAFPQRKKPYKKWIYTAVAAVLLVSLSVTAFVFLSTTQRTENALAYTIIENPSSIIKTVTLPDSSVVEMEPNAQLRYAGNFASKRNVALKGKAFFRVHKDKQHPFKVVCGETTTTVLGTYFTVNGLTENTIEVLLYEGKVQMNVEGDKSNWMLSPGEQFIYKKGTVHVIAFKRFQDFNETPLPEVCAYIKATYGYNVQLPAGYENEKITLRLNQKETLQNVIDIIAQIYELKPTFDEKLKKITLQ